MVSKVPGRHLFLRCGRQMLLIFDPAATSDASAPGPIPKHGAFGPGHVCFAADDAADDLATINAGAIDAWRAQFDRLGVAVERDHVWPDSGSRSLYVRDPAGNSVEVAERGLWPLP